MNHSPVFLEHLRHPRNAGGFEAARRPAAPAAIVTGSAVGERCRDRVTLQLRLDGGRIEEARFLAFGCAGMLATASWATEVLRGLPAAEARALPGGPWARALDLPMEKQHCVALVEEALAIALDEWLHENNGA